MPFSYGSTSNKPLKMCIEHPQELEGYVTQLEMNNI